MLQPVRLALALALAWGAASRADATPGRVKRERPVAVTRNPAEPLPEIRVEKATPTLLLFPAEILKSTVTVDESRIRVVDRGERSIIVQAVEDLRAGERHELSVFFADGRAPARAAFALMTDPSEVDSRMDVERREPPNAACPAEATRPPPGPEEFVLLGYVDERGVPTAKIGEFVDNAQGLESERGGSYIGNGWAIFDVSIRNLPNRPPWTPREATLTGKGGATLRARLVTEGDGAASPGGRVRVLAVVNTPPPSAGRVFTLEVRGDGGRGLAIPRVELPNAGTEGAQ
ncbi:DUF2381 family protein [Myxococcaceae bacterium GXIMD 01537]